MTVVTWVFAAMFLLGVLTVFYAEHNLHRDLTDSDRWCSEVDDDLSARGL